MRIFISCDFPADKLIFDKLSEVLRENRHTAYPKPLWGFFGAKSLTDPDELDEHLRDEDLVIAIISKAYMSDRWLREELHALQTVERKLRPNFLLPIFIEGVEDRDIPEWCFIKPHVDFRGRAVEVGFTELLLRLSELAAKPRLAVFVSYSVKDQTIAMALTNLLSKAFNLTPGEVLCTSVEGHRLPLSANTDEALRMRESGLSLARSESHLWHKVRRGRLQRIRYRPANGPCEYLDESALCSRFASWRRRGSHAKKSARHNTVTNEVSGTLMVAVNS